MTDDAESGSERGLADELADLLLYAPLGLILSIGEDLPKLVEKGRSRVESRVTVARAVGQFAVAMGRRKAEDVVRQRFAPPEPKQGTAPPTAPDTTAAAQPTAPAPAPTAAAAAADTSASSEGRPSRTRKAAAEAPASPPVSATSLAIPGYDSLAASQVVQRLEGLSADELEEVRHYEEATRGRRTILGRISQLAASHS